MTSPTTSPERLPDRTGLLPLGQPTPPAREKPRGRAKRKTPGLRASDSVPAFLIKEIRQSLRSRRFMRSFIGIQLLLQCFTILALLQTGGLWNQDTGAMKVPEETLDLLFWIAIGAPIILLPPLSILIGMGRIYKDRSLELVFLTELTAWRAVFGMWCSHLAEALLITLSTIPYLVLRYYLGGIDLASEFSFFLVLLGISGVISAMTLGLSTYRGLIARMIILLVCGALGFMGCTLLIYMISEFSVSDIQDWRWGVFLLVMLPLWAWIFLQLAASHLSPPAASHSAQIRLGTLALLVLTFAVQIDAEFPSLLFLLFFVTPLLTECLCEPFRAIPPLFAHRTRWFPSFARFSGRVLYPGWPAGLNFVLLFYFAYVGLCLLGGYLAEMLNTTSYFTEEFYYYPLRLVGGHALTIFGAAFFYRLRFPYRDPGQGYFGLAFIAQLLFALLILSFGQFQSSFQELMYVAPIAGGIRAMSDYSQDGMVFIAYILYPLGALICYWLLRSLAQPHWRAMKALERGQPPPLDALALPPSLIEAEELT